MFSCFPGRYQHGTNYNQQLQNVMDQNKDDKMLNQYGETVIDTYQRRLAAQ